MHVRAFPQVMDLRASIKDKSISTAVTGEQRAPPKEDASAAGPGDDDDEVDDQGRPLHGDSGEQRPTHAPACVWCRHECLNV